MVTDQDCDVKNFRELFHNILLRADFSRDLFVLSNISQDTLDYTGPKVNEGSKAILLGLGEIKNQLPQNFEGHLNDDRLRRSIPFCPGALAISAIAYEKNKNLAAEVAQNPAIKDWSIVFLFDDAIQATQSSEDFIWHAFTRFEPAADIQAKAFDTVRYHVSLTTPSRHRLPVKTMVPQNPYPFSPICHERSTDIKCSRL